MACKKAAYDRYFGECTCQLDGRPCRVACGGCKKYRKKRLKIETMD